ncbi:unnamed protein product [Linum tenue]|uniref:Uncharacterized protein n=1 Tax=Linum tenue TaxID=586396 RepID=A0AAV0QVN2_9ROSI|nr:unnamed protein product [Linum tenue]
MVKILPCFRSWDHMVNFMILHAYSLGNMKGENFIANYHRFTNTLHIHIHTPDFNIYTSPDRCSARKPGDCFVPLLARRNFMINILVNDQFLLLDCFSETSGGGAWKPIFSTAPTVLNSRLLLTSSTNDWCSNWL